MTAFRVVEGKSYHCGQMARKLRREQSEALARAGFSTHHEIRTLFDNSPFCRAWMIDGKLAALGGVSGSPVATEGFLWLAVSREAEAHPVAMVKEARKQMGAALCGHRTLVTTIVAADRPSVRLAQHMGFSPVLHGTKDGIVTMRMEMPSVAPPEGRRPFIVFGLPRSRTTWLAAWLGGHHDLAATVDSLSELRALLSEPGAGTVETWMGDAWPLFLSWFPRARIVVVRRSIEESVESLKQCDLRIPRGDLQQRNDRLDEISTLRGVLSVDFDDLNDEKTARAIWEKCKDEPFDADRWGKMTKRDIQLDMPAWKKMLEHRADLIAGLYYKVAARTMPILVQEESFTDLWSDGADIIEEHRQEAGTMDGFPFDPNVDLAAALESAGCLTTIVARCGQKVVGYIMFTTVPSLESRSVTLATQGPWFVSRPFRGRLGLRLHAFARHLLASRGVNGLTMRSGVRGTGPRHFRLYERLGATDVGRMYHLPIGG